MTAVAIQIESFIDEHQPGFVECHLVDAQDQLHVFVEKVPVVSSKDLWSNSMYPQPGSIDCEVEAEWVDSQGRSLVKVNTCRPWSVESTAGDTCFIVLTSQVIRS